MITYIYFVKCPNCEDEHFDFFDEAKEFALGCLNKKPIITQTEVCRNDFGECTDSADLGTVWSWEDIMKDTEAEPTTSVFSKDDFEAFEGDYNPDNDPEFYDIDNSVNFEPVTSEVSAADEVSNDFRKPIPEGMTIDELVEEMEENEDTVECTWCEDLFDKSECRYEVDLGWLCSRCEMAIKSRGETLTFRENNYWDFLDEDLSLEENFKNIARIPDAVELIIQELRQAGFGNYLAAPDSAQTFRPLALRDSANFYYGNIIDIEVTADGIVNLITTIRTIDLAFANRIVRGTKPNIARALVHAIKEAVGKIDKAYAPTRAQRATEKATEKLNEVSAWLNANPKAVAELQQHITNITFKVPLRDDYSFILDEADPDYEKAVKQLEKLHDRFFNLPFAQEAVRQGIAVDREIRESDKYWHIAYRWYATGTITFDCPIHDLIESKHIIEAARVESMSTTGEAAKLDDATSVNCFNLAAALIMHFNNDVRFFEKKTTTAAAVEEDEFNLDFPGVN